MRAESTSTVASLGVPSREEVEFAQRDYLKVSTKHMFTCHVTSPPRDCRYSLGKLGLGLGTKFVPGQMSTRPPQDKVEDYEELDPRHPPINFATLIIGLIFSGSQICQFIRIIESPLH